MGIPVLSNILSTNLKSATKGVKDEQSVLVGDVTKSGEELIHSNTVLGKASRSKAESPFSQVLNGILSQREQNINIDSTSNEQSAVVNNTADLNKLIVAPSEGKSKTEILMLDPSRNSVELGEVGEEITVDKELHLDTLKRGILGNKQKTSVVFDREGFVESKSQGKAIPPTFLEQGGLRLGSSKLDPLLERVENNMNDKHVLVNSSLAEQDQIKDKQGVVSIFQHKANKKLLKTAYSKQQTEDGLLIKSKMHIGEHLPLRKTTQGVESSINPEHLSKTTVLGNKERRSDLDNHLQVNLSARESGKMHVALGRESHVNNQTSLQLDNVRPSDLINKITEYIEQNAVAKNDSLNLTVHHHDLGKFDIAVNHRGNNHQLEVVINSTTREGNNFFHAHEQHLVQKLQQAGFEIHDFKIVSRLAQVEAGRNNSDSMFNNNSNQQRSWSGSHGFSHDQQEADSQRRRSLWEEYRERYYA